MSIGTLQNKIHELNLKFSSVTFSSDFLPGSDMCNIYFVQSPPNKLAESG